MKKITKVLLGIAMSLMALALGACGASNSAVNNKNTAFELPYNGGTVSVLEIDGFEVSTENNQYLLQKDMTTYAYGIDDNSDFVVESVEGGTVEKLDYDLVNADGTPIKAYKITYVWDDGFENGYILLERAVSDDEVVDITVWDDTVESPEDVLYLTSDDYIVVK